MTSARRSDILAAAAAVVSLLIMARTAASSPSGWIWVPWAAAIPFLAMLAPTVQRGAAALIERRPGAAILLPAAWAAIGVALAVLSGAVHGARLLAFPVFIALALWVTGPDRGRPWNGWHILLLALMLGFAAGAWDRAFKIPVPGNTPIGFTFFSAVAFGLFLLTAVRPLETVDVGLAVPGRDLATAAAGFGAVLVIGLPLGFATDFLVWNPRLSDAGFAFARLLGLIVFVGIPEELLFRGMLQEGLTRLTSSRAGWIAASVIFGVAHIFKATGLTLAQRQEFFHLNWRYGLLATVAGLGYGWVYRRTGKVSAAAITHGAVDWLWSGFFGR